MYIYICMYIYIYVCVYINYKYKHAFDKRPLLPGLSKMGGLSKMEDPTNQHGGIKLTILG